MPKRCWNFMLTVLLLVGFGSLSASAQVITGTIYGVVQDESQGAMPGVTVTVRHVETGVSRSAVTDGEGRYHAPNLALGEYRVEAELQGFQTSVRTGIVLTVGREAEVNFTLGVGSLTESVEVTGEAPLVETSKSVLATLVDQRQIAELPLNSRSYTDLALLTPGVMTTSRSASFSATTGGGVKLSIGGARPTNTGFYVDGVDTKDAYGRTPGSAAGTTLGVDTIREFQVLTNNFSAQYGGSGGVINAVTKSGTNAFHGNTFWFLRRDSFDKTNFFDAFGKPEFKRDQAGFTIGGPIKRERTFFFVSYEHFRQRQHTTQTLNVPGPGLRAGITPTGNVVVNATSKKFLDAMPLPNGAIKSDGIGEYKFQDSAKADEDYIMAKVDQQLTANDSFFVRFTSDVASNLSPNAFPGFFVDQNTKGRYMVSEYNRILSPTLLNTARFSFNRPSSVLVNVTDGIDLDPSLSFVPGGPPQQFSIPGLSSWGNDAISDRGYYLSTIQASERLSWTKGMHALVAGMEFQHNDLRGYSASRLFGRVTFNSLNDFLIGVPRTWEFLVPGTGSDPAPKDELRSFRQFQYAFYVQDDLKPRSNLTLNLGLRWEFVTKVTELEGRLSTLINPTDPEETVGRFLEPKKANFGPRLGVAWDPSGAGKTSIRGGLGVFYQPLNYTVYQVAVVQNAPFFLRAELANPAWPPPYNPKTIPPSAPTPIELKPSSPYYMHYNATYQRQLLGDLVASISYAGSRGRHLPSAENGNPFTFQTLPDGRKFWGSSGAQVRLNPAFEGVSYRKFNNVSDYNSLQLRVSKRFGAGLQVQSAYTLARGLDNGSEVQMTAYMDPLDPRRDYGPSQLDVRHNWTANFIYQLPFFRDGSGPEHFILGGWQVSGLVSAQAGTPRNVNLNFNRSRDGNVLSGAGNNNRPNLKAGADSNPIAGDGRDPDKYADVSSFELQPAGFHGNLGRNTLVGPGVVQFDMSLVKSFGLGGERRAEFRVEFFNLFDRLNLGSPTTSAFTNASGPNPNFGRITSTSTTARQGQLALKMIF